MAARAFSFVVGWMKLAVHVCQDGHYANNIVLFGRIDSLRCRCGQVFWTRPRTGSRLPPSFLRGTS